MRRIAAVPDQRWGLTLPFAGVPLHEHGPLLRRAEAAGYDDLWTGETAGADGFTPLVLAAAHTERLRLGTGIVNPFTRGPAVLAQHAAALADASRGRFVLGLGSSSNVIVERWNGVPFERPLSKVREAVAQLRPMLAGDRGPGGFRLEQPPAHPVPIVLAALRGRMLALAAEVADGAFTNFLPISGARQVADAFGARDKELVCRFFCLPQAADEALPTARFMFAAYATVPVYTDFFRWLGWGEQLQPMVAAWQAGDRRRALELVPDELVREIFLFGSPEQMHDRLRGFAEAGVTTFVLTPICAPGEVSGAIDALARDGAGR
jgi:probable F420-dependent oxidoreductase